MENENLSRNKKNSAELKMIFGLSFLILMCIFLIFCMRADAEGSGEDYPYSGNGDWVINDEFEKYR